MPREDWEPTKEELLERYYGSATFHQYKAELERDADLFQEMLEEETTK